MKRALLTAFFAICAVGSVQAGVLYAINDNTDSLVTIDRTTYAVTTIGALGIAGDFGDMTWNSSTGLMYAVGRGNNALYTINTMTGSAALVGSHGINDMFSLATTWPTDCCTGKRPTATCIRWTRPRALRP